MFCTTAVVFVAISDGISAGLVVLLWKFEDVGRIKVSEIILFSLSLLSALYVVRLDSTLCPVTRMIWRASKPAFDS